MHVISKRPLREFWSIHPEAKSPLNDWFNNDLRKTFPSADWVEGLVVFNIGGNKYRLIAAVHCNTQKVCVRHVLTHPEYDRMDLSKK